jgi:uracil-DNA glycosylase family 4
MAAGGDSREAEGAVSRRAVRQRLQSLADAGVTDLPKSGRGRKASPRPARPAVAAGISSSVGSRPLAGGDREAGLEVIRREVSECVRCPELACSRTNTVFGAGPATARLCFFGEAPGADEDASGLPFVGRAGQLLNKIIEACQLSRDDVYIFNVLKCRPPNNRPPLSQEVANCREYFERQIEVIAPEFICCLGTSAAQALLQTEEPIGKLRGRWFTHGSAQVICTYHPSYLLRNPGAKRHVWDDMKLLMARMGVDL